MSHRNWILCLGILSFYCLTAVSSEPIYTGELTFKAGTNISKVSLQGKTSKFQKLEINFIETKPQLLNIEAIVEMSSLLPTIYFSNFQIYKNTFSTKNSGLLKLKLTGANCTAYKNGYECVGAGEFLFAKAGFTKIIKIMLDEKLNASSVFSLSQKELNLKPHRYVGVEIDDQVNVYLNAFHK